MDDVTELFQRFHWKCITGEPIWVKWGENGETTNIDPQRKGSFVLGFKL